MSKKVATFSEAEELARKLQQKARKLEQDAFKELAAHKKATQAAQKKQAAIEEATLQKEAELTKIKEDFATKQVAKCTEAIKELCDLYNVRFNAVPIAHQIPSYNVNGQFQGMTITWSAQVEFYYVEEGTNESTETTN